MSKVINDHLEEFYGVRISWFSSPQFLRYSIGGLYEPHTDGEDLVGGKLHRIFDRDFSLLIYLNDDYEGGELVFPIQKLTIKPKAYQAVFFPSSIRFSHGAKKLLTGKRYAFVSWLTAVGTRRECKVTPDRVMRDNDKGKFS
jgi:predicted 2-oxoglutarate/Fe(II)-dependent dioxygenase YbiX